MHDGGMMKTCDAWVAPAAPLCENRHSPDMRPARTEIPSMQHILLTCKLHTHLKWTTKSIAVNADGSYNGARHIFSQQDDECTCSPNLLTFADETEKAKWQADQS